MVKIEPTCFFLSRINVSVRSAFQSFFISILILFINGHNEEAFGRRPTEGSFVTIEKHLNSKSESSLADRPSICHELQDYCIFMPALTTVPAKIGPIPCNNP
jgi:hypothetical protein